jgi:hypothetical protein
MACIVAQTLRSLAEMYDFFVAVTNTHEEPWPFEALQPVSTMQYIAVKTRFILVSDFLSL